VLLLIAGCLAEVISTTLVRIPIPVPMTLALGIDPVRLLTKRRFG